MKGSPQICLGRLLTGAALNVVLLLMIPRVAVWSSVEREFWLALTASALGAIAIVCVLPVLWRGKDPQRVFAVMLLLLPFLTFWLVADFVLSYR